VLEYREEMSKIIRPLRDVKEFGKKIADFFRDYGKCLIRAYSGKAHLSE
jgi:hypothetical protein